MQGTGSKPGGFDVRPPSVSPRLRKALGQHHLRDPAACRSLLDFLQPDGAEVVEIGSGGGVLTRGLVEAGARVTALDLDPAWLIAGRHRLGTDAASVRWVAADAMQFPWESLPRPWLVAGNLPYNVATPIVRGVLESGAAPRMGFLVQKEVAERMTAEPGSRAYGVLTLSLQWWAQVQPLGVVKPGSFKPPPKVTSQFVGLTRRADLGGFEEYRQVMAVAELAFTHRRKTLVNSLRSRFHREALLAWCTDAGLALTVRPENLSLAEFRSLASQMQVADATRTG